MTRQRTGVWPAAVAGLVLGAGAGLVPGWRWWLVATGIVAVVGMIFLSTAFWPRGQWVRWRDHREGVKQFTDAPFPLYGLPPSWTGPRFLAGGGNVVSGRRHSSTSLCLATAIPRPMMRHCCGLRPRTTHHPTTFAGACSPWTTVDIPVDGHPVQLSTERTSWCALTTHRGTRSPCYDGNPPAHSADRVTDQRLATAAAVELGYVGLSPASTLAETGHPVIGYDISDTRLANIKAGRVDLLAADRARLRRHGPGQQCASVPARKRTLP